MGRPRLLPDRSFPGYAYLPDISRTVQSPLLTARYQPSREQVAARTRNSARMYLPNDGVGGSSPFKAKTPAHLLFRRNENFTRHQGAPSLLLKYPFIMSGGL